MECAEVLRLLDTYFDDELDAVTTLDIERHLAGCRSCSGSLGAYETLRAGIRNESMYSTAPEAFRNRVRDTVRRETRHAVPLLARTGTWQAVAAVLLLALVGMWSLTTRRPVETGETLAGEVLSNHIRSLMADHLTDVQSSDQHTVKPWFDGRLKFSPPVPDFPSNGFILAGGRQEYINNQEVAALVYRRRNHIINLYTWYAESPERSFSTQANQGYNLISWSDKGIQWWAVSDLNAEELGDFCRLVKEWK